MRTSTYALAFAVLFGGAATSAPAVGLPAYSDALMSLLASAKDGTWIRVDGNFDQVIPPRDLQPTFGNVAGPKSVLRAHGAMAWNPNAGELMVTGGGHAVYSGNDVYAWSAMDLQWRRLSLPTEVNRVSSTIYETADGPENSPIGAHLFDGLAYLPVADRMLSFGGAAFNTGGSFEIFDPTINDYRLTGPYTFDPSRADGNKVGGLDYSGVDPKILGTQAWQNRDSVGKLVEAGFNGGFLNTTSYAYVEDDKDVVLFKPSKYGGAELWKLTINDPDNPQLDSYEQAGLGWIGSDYVSAGSYDPEQQVFIQLDTTKAYFWDLSSGVPQRSERVTMRRSGKTLEFDSFSLSNSPGMDYDPIRDQFLIWEGFRRIYTLTAPDDLDDPWLVDRLRPGYAFDPADIPADNTIGVHGSWQYIPDYDIFIGLADYIHGDISIYKPLDWQPSWDWQPALAVLQVPIGSPLTLFLAGLAGLGALQRWRSGPRRRNC